MQMRTKRGKDKMQPKPHRLASGRPRPRKLARLKSGPGSIHAREGGIKTKPVKPIPGKHILFVDDEAMVARMGERTLSRLGYTVTAITNSTEALEKFRAEPNKFDIVVTDHIMPDMSGIGLAKKLLEIRPDIPIVLTSGYGDEIDEHLCRAAGIREYAAKPFQMQSLSQLIDKLIKTQR
jgi:CheY-like chemotaxis protein